MYIKPPKIKVYIRPEIREAAKDFFYLLNRGYNRESSLNLISSRYRLSKIERLILYRGVYSREVSKARIKKMEDIRKVKRKELIVDSFNVLSTIQSSILGDTLLLCTDGVIRDLSAYVRKVRVGNHLYVSLVILLGTLLAVNPPNIFFIFDSQVSKSAEIASITRKLCQNFGLMCKTVLARRADKTTIMLSRDSTVSSSDSVILDSVKNILDLGGFIANIISPENIINICRWIEDEEIIT